MSIQRRLVPADNFPLSLGVGVLTPLLILVLGWFLPQDLFLGWWLTMLLSPFLSGLSASLAYGTDSPGEIGYSILLSILAAFGLCLVLIAFLCIAGAEPPGPGMLIAWAIYMGAATLPFSIIYLVILATVGALLGRGIARGVGR